MKRAFALFVVAVLVGSVAATASARPAFPEFIPFERPVPDVSPGELPEGVAVDKVGNVFVSVDTIGQVWIFTPDGDKTVYYDFGEPGALGLAVDATGNVYVARGLGYAGVWKIDRGGEATLVAGTDQIFFANALAFDKRGNLYVSETFSVDETIGYACPGAVPGPILGGQFGPGGIWVVPKGGEAELWYRDPVVADPFTQAHLQPLSGLCLFPIPYPIGANGIAYRHGNVFVNNTEKALVLRIPVEKGGAAGAPEIITQVTGVDPDFGPPGLDGMALDVYGDIYVPVINQSRIVKIAPDGSSVETIATLADGLDFPASLAFGTGKGERQSLFATNFSLGPPIFAGPGLVKLDAGVPGMPIP